MTTPALKPPKSKRLCRADNFIRNMKIIKSRKIAKRNELLINNSEINTLIGDESNANQILAPGRTFLTEQYIGGPLFSVR